MPDGNYSYRRCTICAKPMQRPERHSICTDCEKERPHLDAHVEFHQRTRTWATTTLHRERAP